MQYSMEFNLLNVVKTEHNLDYIKFIWLSENVCVHPIAKRKHSLHIINYMHCFPLATCAVNGVVRIVVIVLCFRNVPRWLNPFCGFVKTSAKYFAMFTLGAIAN